MRLVIASLNLEELGEGWKGRLRLTDVSFYMCACVKSLQLCPTLCKPTDCSPPGFCIHGILQVRILPGIEPVSLMSPALADGFFTTSLDDTTLMAESEEN